MIKSALSLRKRSHLATRLELRDENAHAYRLIPWLALADISFCFVDWWAGAGRTILFFLSLRVFGVVLARVLYLLSRGRLRYGARLFLTIAPYMAPVQYVMISEGLVFSPYFAGPPLIMITASMLFPTRLKISMIVYFILALPILVWLATSPYPKLSDNVLVVAMVLGSIFIVSLNADQVNQDLKAKLIVKEILTRDLGKRQKEIREKAEELVKRRVFESQFSPQVVSALLRDRTLTRDMKRFQISNIVIDIQNSTTKANTIDPKHYKEVVEEVLDVFSAACLKWNITLDKFLGDGVQAFAGAPMPQRDDLERSIHACRETIQMLHARKAALEMLWKDELNVRFAVCEGEALIGFIGRGVFKSYTAVGDMVSFTHRLSAVPEPWTIATYSWNSSVTSRVSGLGFIARERLVGNLKGFGDKVFRVTILDLIQEQGGGFADAGRCPQCETPLVLEETKMGLPKIYCPACQGQGQGSSAAA
jgi:class 3 adenylate cyclase